MSQALSRNITWSGNSDTVLAANKRLDVLTAWSMSANAMLRQLASVRRTAAAASRSLLALPHSFRAAALTDEQLVYGCPTVLARVLAPAASRRLLDAFAA